MQLRSCEARVAPRISLFVPGRKISCRGFLFSLQDLRKPEGRRPSKMKGALHGVLTFAAGSIGDRTESLRDRLPLCARQHRDLIGCQNAHRGLKDLKGRIRSCIYAGILRRFREVGKIHIPRYGTDSRSHMLRRHRIRQGQRRQCQVRDD